MSKVQVSYCYDKPSALPDYVELTTLAAPLSLDSFDYNFFNLQSKSLWVSRASKEGTINQINDFKSIKTMLFRSCSAINVIVLPQNIDYRYNYTYIGVNTTSHKDYTRKAPIKDMLGICEAKIFSELIPGALPSLYYENTTTTINGQSLDASFYFEQGEAITLSDKSNKATTVLTRDRTFVTTLDIFSQKASFEAFLECISPKIPKQTYPDWLSAIDILDDKIQKLNINQSRAVIIREEEKIQAAEILLVQNQGYKSILCNNGGDLVEVVFELLQELLDCDLSNFHDTLKEDFEIKKDLITFIGEIKGVTSNVRSEHISQLDVHCQSYSDTLQEAEQEEKIKGLLIINHQRNVEPTTRQPIHDNQIALAKRNSSLIIETTELLKLFEWKRLGKISSQQICDIFSSSVGAFYCTEDILHTESVSDNSAFIV